MEFTVNEDKSFVEDIKIIFEALRRGEHFSFSKYVDGEFAILKNQPITNCDNWTFNPERDSKEQQELLKSFTYNEEGYFVGISCPCCVSWDDVKWMRDTVKVAPTNLTWANIFVNGNYNFFKDNFIPEFQNHDIILFANADAKVENLPFEIEAFVPITNTAWKDNFYLLDNFPIEDYEGKLFLFCAGPLGNMLAAKFWSLNKKNTYIDIGSTLNTWLVGNNRGYLRGAPTIKKICIW